MLAAPSADELRVCEIINEQRVANGAAPLRFSDELFRAAVAHSTDMAEHECFKHDSCDGTLWSKRIRSYYPGAIALGENIAQNTSNPAGIVAGWMNSAGHRANILGTFFTDVGCGLALGRTNFGLIAYATADFGSRGLLPVSTPTPQVGPSTTPTAVVTPAAVGVDRVTLRSARTATTLNARLLLPLEAQLDEPVALEIDGELVAAIPADCIEIHGRGARSTCTGADVRITPAGLPRYRIRLRFAGQHVPTSSVRLSAVGQIWDLTP